MEQQKRTHHLSLALVGAALFALGMTVAAAFDLQINQAVYNPHSPVSIAFECFGHYPLYALPLVWAMLMAMDDTLLRTRRILAGAMVALGVVALFVNSTLGLLSRGVELAVVFCGGVWLLLLTNLAKLLRTAPATQRRVRFALGWGVAYAAANTVLVNVMKSIWQRTRFDDMSRIKSFEAFTPWYQIPGNGGNSFPSGHTAAACGVFILILLCDVLPAWQKRRTLVWAGCWAYVAAMAVCRVVIGRHYLSDTLVAMFVMAVLLLFLSRMSSYRRGVSMLLAREKIAQRKAARDSGAAQNDSAAPPENRESGGERIADAPDARAALDTQEVPDTQEIFAVPDVPAAPDTQEALDAQDVSDTAAAQEQTQTGEPASADNENETEEII